MMVTADDQVKAYIKKIMGQLKEWMYGGKISKLVVVITSKETGEHVERWQFDVSALDAHTAGCLTPTRCKSLGKARRAKHPRKQATRKMQSQSKCSKLIYVGAEMADTHST